MSITLEKMFDSLLLKRVPENWENVAYPSLKPIGSWMPDLIQRVAFFKNWAQNDLQDSYWLSAMFFPQGNSFFLNHRLYDCCFVDLRALNAYCHWYSDLPNWSPIIWTRWYTNQSTYRSQRSRTLPWRMQVELGNYAYGWIET